MLNDLVRLLATFFYVGYLPMAPGSMASAAGVLIVLILSSSHELYMAAFVAITILGFVVSGRMEEIAREKDPGCVVIDEVAGILLAFYALPLTWPVIITAFFLFRAFDMFKIYPVNKLEKMPGSVGIMMDDLVAGVYTNLVMQIAVRLADLI